MSPASPRTITSARLCRAIGIPDDRLAQWVHRGIVAGGEEEGLGRGRAWNLAEAISIAALVRVLAGNRSTSEASASAVAMVRALGELLEAALAPELDARWRRVDAIAFITAELASGETVLRVAWTELDAAHLVAELLVKRVRRLELLDMTESYVAVLEAFGVAAAQKATMHA